MASSVDELVEAIRGDRRLGGQLVHAAHLPPSAAVPGDLSPPLSEPLRRALEGSGIPALWSHQAEGIAAARRGEDVLITTPTASGKSLVFQVPILEEALAGRPGRALFLFPLKALGQDQKAKLDALAAAVAEAEGGPPTVDCEIYDGDTPPSRRAAIKKRFPRVVVSNPDMVHLAVVAFWSAWRPFLRDLRWVVLDEIHTYRGIFGSHFHHVLARLLRLARAEGAVPSIIASSATAENAPDFAAALAGRPFRWISGSGAPREGRHLLLFRPESSPYTASLDLFVRFLEAGMKTIVFTKARRITELLYSWLRKQYPEFARSVASYRAGFLPEERRQIERDLFTGRLRGVISTSALEMGIDVGGLDACILVGYPGSMMATWQRSGRVGRAGRESLTALVALPDALDQYFLDHPEEFLSRPCEQLIVDPGNVPVARAHLVCAAAELPLSRGLDAAYLDRAAPVVADLLERGELLEAVGGEIFAARKRPQRNVNLRGTGASYTIEDGEGGRVIGTVDGVRALHECHPGAIYLHAGRQYRVQELDLDDRRARAEAADVDYFTSPLAEKETEILEVLGERRPAAGEGVLHAWLGRLKVTERVVGYERKRIFGQEVLDQHPLDLPPVSFETVGLWWAAGPEVEETLRRSGEHFLGALHASEHAAISLFPLLALCDRGDIGGISYPRHPQVGTGAVFIYDGHPGGVGIAARGFEALRELLGRVGRLLEECRCEEGCPSCVQSPKCGNGNRPLDKAGAARVLRLLLGREAPATPPGPPPELDLAASRTAPDARRREPATGARPSRRRGGAAEAAAPKEGAAGVQVAPSPTASASRRTVLFDLETLRSAEEVGGWGNAHRMGVALGVVCHLEEGCFETFDEARVPDLVEVLCGAELVVGFNVKRFDYRVLAGYTGVDYARKLPTLDLLEEIHRRLGFRVGMNDLAQATLGVGKTADGLQSLAWVKEGRLDLVEAYCRRDVEVLRDLYLHGRREGYLLYPDRRHGVPVKIQVAW